MTNNLSLPIIAAGTPDSESILESDGQVYTRLEKIRIRPFEPDDDFRDFLSRYKIAKFRGSQGLRGFRGSRYFRGIIDADFKDDQLVEKIHSSTNGLVGHVTNFMSLAVEHAIRTGSEHITLETLKEIPITPLNTAFSKEKKNPYGI